MLEYRDALQSEGGRGALALRILHVMQARRGGPQPGRSARPVSANHRAHRSRGPRALSPHRRRRACVWLPVGGCGRATPRRRAAQGFGGYLADLPAGAPAARRLAQAPGAAATEKSSQFDVAGFARPPDVTARCTRAAGCFPGLAQEASAVVAIVAVDLRLGSVGRCTGAASRRLIRRLHAGHAGHRPPACAKARGSRRACARRAAGAQRAAAEAAVSGP